jgi:HlyD family secretion protein
MIKGLLFFLISVMLLGGCKSKQEVIKPQQREITEAVYASGTLVPEQEYKLVSRLEGYVTESLVEEGDTVKNGQLLFRISNSNKQTAEQTAASLVAKTLPVVGDRSPAVRELEGKIDLLSIRQTNDSIQYLRYKTLFEQNAISKSSYEKYELQYKSTSRELDNLRQQLNNVKLNASLQLQQANNLLAVSKADVENGLLRSFTNGVVYEIYKKQGDILTVNQPIALIGSGRMIVKLLADEDDLDKVKMGQKILMTMDAYPDKIINARVVRIYPILNKVEQSFRVDAAIEDSLPSAIYGLNVEANIIIREKRLAMVIPKSALFHSDSVWIKKANEVVAVKVEKGTEDREWIEIRSGLNAETEIIIKK